MNVPQSPDHESLDPWALHQEPDGMWRALINLRGQWVPLGYFGAREDAEATIAAYFKPQVRAQ